MALARGGGVALPPARGFAGSLDLRNVPGGEAGTLASVTLHFDTIRKNPRVRKIFVRNSGAGNGCINFMDAWKNAFFLQEKPMSIKFL